MLKLCIPYEHSIILLKLIFLTYSNVFQYGIVGSFYIVIKGERILVIRSTTVERLSGYFIETADGPQFRGTSISRASVGGMKGYWVLIDGQLQFAQRSPLSVRNGDDAS